jgi:hypothetical protein
LMVFLQSPTINSTSGRPKRTNARPQKKKD